MRHIGILLFLFFFGLQGAKSQDFFDFTALTQQKATDYHVNLLRILMAMQGQSAAQRHELVDLALRYSLWESDRALAGLEPFVVPSWTLESEIDFLRQSVPELSLERLPIHSKREELVRLSTELDPMFERAFNQFKRFGDRLVNSGDFRLGNPDAEKFFQLFFDYYFQNIPRSTLQNIASDILALKRAPLDDELLQIMLKNSGPGVGKLIQQLGKDPHMGEGLAHVLDVLEDGNKVVPDHLGRELIMAHRGALELTDIAERPLGVGTLAQVNQAMLTTADGPTPVAVRFLKPEIEQRAHADIRIFRRFLDEPRLAQELNPEFLSSIRKLMGGLENFLLAELDVEASRQKQVRASTLYERSVQVMVDRTPITVEIHVPHVYEVPRSSPLIVQELIERGQKFDQLEALTEKQAISRSLSRMWFEEALLESGFIHADLHQGNFTIQHRGANHLKVVLFDLGMAEEVERPLRRAFLLMSAGVRYQDAGLIARGLMAANGTPFSSELTAIVREEMLKGSYRVEEWILWGIRTGHLTSDQLAPMARGASLVTQLPRSLGRAEELLFTRSMIRSAAKKIVRQTLQGENPVLGPADMARLSGAFAKKSCRELIKSLSNF
jgi:ubiquinone biosynthesis protein